MLTISEGTPALALPDWDAQSFLSATSLQLRAANIYAVNLTGARMRTEHRRLTLLT